jgi:hypothetical protein
MSAKVKLPPPTDDEVHAIMDRLLDAPGADQNGLDWVRREFIRAALVRAEGKQVDAAENIGESPRVVNYQIAVRGLRGELDDRTSSLWKDIKQGLPMTYNQVSGAAPTTVTAEPVAAVEAGPTSQPADRVLAADT